MCGKQCRARLCCDLCGNLFCGRSINMRNENSGSRPGKHETVSLADAVAAAGYDNDFFFQPSDHPHERSVLTTDLTQCRIDQCLGWKHFGDFSAYGASPFFDLLPWKDMSPD